MTQEFPEFKGTSPKSLVEKIQLVYQNQFDKAVIQAVPDVDTHLTLLEHLWYIVTPAILKTGSTLLKGTLAGNIFAVAESEIPNFPPSQTREGTMDSKKWYASKTIWVNVIGVGWMLLQKPLGLPELDTATEATILGILNVILRFVTKSEVTIQDPKG